jgi:hypothetical protein
LGAKEKFTGLSLKTGAGAKPLALRALEREYKRQYKNISNKLKT